MSTTVEQLRIELQSDTKSAEQGIERATRGVADFGAAAGPAEQRLTAMEQSVDAGVKRLADSYERMGHSAESALAKAEGQRGNVQSQVIKQAAADVEKLTGAHTRSGAAAEKTGGIMGKLQGQVTQAGEAMAGTGLEVVGLGAGLGILAGAGIAAIRFLADSIQTNMEAARVSRAVTAAYRDQAAGYTAFAQQLSSQTGYTKNSILEAAVTARTLSQNYGLTVQQTQNLIRVSADLANVRGIGVAEAFERVQSAIRGEAEASEYLGLTLNDTFLKQRGLTQGMSDAEKAQIRYSEIIRQSAQFQGLAKDAANSTEGQFRLLSNTSTDLATNLGKALDPVLQRIAKGLGAAAKGAADLVKASNEIDAGRAKESDIQADLAKRGIQVSGKGTYGRVRPDNTVQVLTQEEIAAERALSEANLKGQLARQKMLEEAHKRETGQALPSPSPDEVLRQESEAASEYAKVWTAALRARRQATIDAIDAQSKLFEISQEPARIAIRTAQRSIEEQEVGPKLALSAIEHDMAIAQRSRLDLTQRESQLTLEMIPARRALADLQERMQAAQERSVALQLDAQRIEAQRGALGAQRALEDLDYRRQILGLRVELNKQEEEAQKKKDEAAAADAEKRHVAPQAVPFGGLPKQPSVKPPNLQEQLDELDRQRPQAQLDALRAERPITLADRAAQDQQLAVAARQNALQQEQVGIQATVDAISKKQSLLKDEQETQQARTALVLAAYEAEKRSIEDTLWPLTQQRQLLDAASSALDRQAAAYADMLAPARLAAMAELVDYQRSLALAGLRGSNAPGSGAGLRELREGDGKASAEFPTFPTGLSQSGPLTLTDNSTITVNGSNLTQAQLTQAIQDAKEHTWSLLLSAMRAGTQIGDASVPNTLPGAG